jgi:hypothetical protein
MLFKFLQVPKPRPFEIKPRYYDPVKEEREERERRIKAELGIRDDSDPSASYRAHIKGQFRKQMEIRPKSSDAEVKKSNNRLIFLVVLLAILAYLMFYR